MGRKSIESLCAVNPENLGGGTSPDYEFGYVDISAVSSQRVGSAQVQRIQFAAAPSRARRVLNHGDILLSTVRPGLKAHARITHDLGLPLVGSTGFAALRPHMESDSSFVFHSILGASVSSQLRRWEVGSNYPAVNESDVRRLCIFCPEPKTRARIAYVLDTIDEAIQKTEAVIDKLKRIRAGMLHDLLTYGLDKDGTLRDPVAHPEQFKDSELGRIPKEWEIVAVQEICNTYAGGTPSRSVPGFFGGDIPWVKSTEANRAAIAETEETISTQGFNASSVKWIPAGVPLMAMYGATAGQVTWLTIRATSNQAVLAIVPTKETVEARCLYWILRRETPKIVRQATGSGQPNLSKALIDKWRIAFPKEPSEQHAIAIALDQAVQSEAAEHAHMQKLRSLKAGLMDDLLSGVVSVPEELPVEGVPE